MKKITIIIITAIIISGLFTAGIMLYRKQKVANNIKKTDAILAKTDVTKLTNVDKIFTVETKWNIDLKTKAGQKQLDDNIAIMKQKTAALP